MLSGRLIPVYRFGRTTPMRAVAAILVSTLLLGAALAAAEDKTRPGTLLMVENNGNPIVLRDSDTLITGATFKPPVEITLVAKTDSTNIRVGYAANQIIFNWELHKKQLRVDGGPAN
jgi:hypothetical protein